MSDDEVSPRSGLDLRGNRHQLKAVLDAHRDDQFVYKILKMRRDQLKEWEQGHFIHTAFLDNGAEKVSYKDLIRPFEERIQSVEAENKVLKSVLTVKPEKNKKEIDEYIEKKVEKLLEEPRKLMLQTMEKTMKMMEQHGRLEMAHKELEEKQMAERNLKYKENIAKMVEALESEIRTAMDMERRNSYEDKEEVEKESDKLDETQQPIPDVPEEDADEVEHEEQQVSDEVEVEQQDNVKNPSVLLSVTENSFTRSRSERIMPPATDTPLPPLLPPAVFRSPVNPIPPASPVRNIPTCPPLPPTGLLPGAYPSSPFATAPPTLPPPAAGWMNAAATMQQQRSGPPPHIFAAQQAYQRQVEKTAKMQEKLDRQMQMQQEMKTFLQGQGWANGMMGAPSMPGYPRSTLNNNGMPPSH